MLLAIRDKTKGIFAAVILALFAIPFVLWGTYSYFDAGMQINIAKVDGEGIKYEDYQRALDQLSGSDISPEVLASEAFKMRVAHSLIDQQLLMVDAVDQGYRTSDVVINEFIRQLPNFQLQGKFNQEMYERFLRQQRLTSVDFRERLRVMSLIEQVKAGIVQSVFITESDNAAIAVLLSQKRKVSYINIDSQQFEKNIKVSQEEVGEYYSANSTRFKNPERIRIKYIRLSIAELMKNYRPTAKELRETYAVELARFTTPARRRVSHILFELPAAANDDEQNKVKEKIKDVENQLQKGAAFSTLAKKFSDDPLTAKKGGDLGFVTSGVLPNEVEQALVGLRTGKVSKPIRSNYGYHIIKLTEYKPEKKKSFAEVRNEIDQLTRQLKAEDRFINDADRFGNLVYEHPESLTPAAEDLGLEIQQSDWFTRSGGVGITADKKVLAAAFTDDVLTTRQNSEIIEIGTDALIAIRVIDHQQATLKPLVDVQGQIRRELKQQHALNKAKSLGQELFTQLQSGADLASLARKHKLTIKKPPAFIRSNPPELNPALTNAIFKTQRPEDGKVVYGYANLGNAGYTVFVLKSVEDGHIDKTDPAMQENIKRLLIQHRGEGYYTNYRGALKAEADLKIFSDKL